MPDYNKGCIYKIKHQLDYNDENIYIGSTCNFIRRRSQHKNRCYSPNDKSYDIKLYQYIRENGGWEQFIMVELHKFPCKDKPELSAEERRVIDELKSKLNCTLPGRTQKEYREQNKDMIKEINKEYREQNKEKFKEYHKKYRETNKDNIYEQRKEYREQNKEKIKEYHKKKLECDNCKSVVCLGGLAKHKKTQKCINFKSE